MNRIADIYPGNGWKKSNALFYFCKTILVGFIYEVIWLWCWVQGNKVNLRLFETSPVFQLNCNWPCRIFFFMTKETTAELEAKKKSYLARIAVIKKRLQNWLFFSHFSVTRSWKDKTGGRASPYTPPKHCGDSS